MPVSRAALSTADIRAVTHIKLSSAIMVDSRDTAAKMIRMHINIIIIPPILFQLVFALHLKCALNCYILDRHYRIERSIDVPQIECVRECHIQRVTR